MRLHYQKNKEIYKQKSKKNNRRKSSILKEYLNWLKSVPCADCGREWMPHAMDFDHVKGEKRFNLSAIAQGNKTWDEGLIQEEIEKCEVVCACCHRIRSYNRTVR